MATTEYLHEVQVYCPEGAAEYTDTVEAHEIESHLAAGGGGRRQIEASVLKAFRAADASEGIPTTLMAGGVRWTLVRDHWSRANNANCYVYGTDGTSDRDIAFHERRMAYDGEGREVGNLTLAEARARYGSARYETDSDTITVGE